APTICDIIILNIVGTKGVYKEAKFEVLTRDEIQQRALTKKISQTHSKSNLESYNVQELGLSSTVPSGPIMPDLDENRKPAP
ncbi:hypothetical protein ACTXT7_016351, partial [Hymenolepis weldensis]